MNYRLEYENLLKSGMFFEFHPQLKGNWSDDCTDYLKEINVITDDMSMSDSLNIILDNMTEQERIDSWEQSKDSDLVGPTFDEFIKTTNHFNNIQMTEDEMFIKTYDILGHKHFCKMSDDELKKVGHSLESINNIKIKSVKSELTFYDRGIETYKIINELKGGINN